jgi:4-amino-4-deoxy-L-arabinose transferase-like glycosyltransferase
MKTSMLGKLKKYWLFLVIVFIAILPRFALLDKVPNAITQDELHYTIDSKSFFFTGKDLLGQVTPIDVLLFHFPQSEPLQAELQYFLEIPIFGLLGFSMFNLILPNALISVLTVILIYLITLKLFNKNAAIFAGSIAAINPWLIFMGRTTYESGPAPLFFLSVFYILLKTSGWKILLTIPMALLAFYSYIGTKLIFLPFIFFVVAYSYLYVNKRKYLKQYLILLLFSVFLIVFFVFQLKQFQATRNAEILLPTNPQIANQVMEFRKATMQNSYLNLFDNKISTYLTVLTKNTFNALSFNYLFVSADYFFMLGAHGLFYYLDAVFLIIGFCFLSFRNKKLLALFVLLILLGIIPQAIHNPKGDGNFTPHITLIIPFLIILIGLGINVLLEAIKNKKILYLSGFILFILYAVAFLNFSYIYFYKFPLQEGTFETQNRILAKYISLYNGKAPITVYSTNRKQAFREFLFYSDIYNKNTALQINLNLKNEKFVYKNVSFVSCDNLRKPTSLTVVDVSCPIPFFSKAIRIAQLKDSGNRYYIYNDSICKQFGLSNYISKLKLSDFDMENLTPKIFCEKFIIAN